MKKDKKVKLSLKLSVIVAVVLLLFFSLITIYESFDDYNKDVSDTVREMKNMSKNAVSQEDFRFKEANLRSDPFQDSM